MGGPLPLELEARDFLLHALDVLEQGVAKCRHLRLVGVGLGIYVGTDWRHRLEVWVRWSPPRGLRARAPVARVLHFLSTALTEMHPRAWAERVRTAPPLAALGPASLLAPRSDGHLATLSRK